MAHGNHDSIAITNNSVSPFMYRVLYVCCRFNSETNRDL